MSPLNPLFAPARFVADHVFATKHNQLGIVFELQGLDHECLADGTMANVSQRLSTAWRQLDDSYRIYQYVIKHGGPEISTSDNHHDLVVEETLRNRNEYLRSKAQELYSVRPFWVLMYESGKAKNPRRLSESALKQNIARLMTRAKSLQATIHDLVSLEMLSKTGVFAFLRLLTSLDADVAIAEHQIYDNHLDYWTAARNLACHRTGVRLDDSYLEVLNLRKPPKETFPNILRELVRVQSNFVLCSEFKRLPNERSIRLVNTAQSHFNMVKNAKSWPATFASALGKAFGASSKEIKVKMAGASDDSVVPDQSAIDNVEELKTVNSRINTDDEYMGEYTLSLILHAKDRALLQGSVAEAVKVIGKHEGSLIRETIPEQAMNAYLATIPGNNRFNFRSIYMMNTNYADLTFAYAPLKGTAFQPHLKKEHLIVFETNDRTPYYFNLYDNEPANFLLFGVMGSGKSFLTGMLGDHAMKYDPFISILDVGGSYRAVVEKHGGSYLTVRSRGNDFTMNPFSLPKTAEHLEFLASFVGILLHHSGYDATPQDDRLIDLAVRKAERLSDLDLPERIKDYLYNWTGDGRYAHLFDHRDDTLSLARLQCFDFQSSSTNPKVLGPLFFYLFQRIFQTAYDPAFRNVPKFLLADECWKFLATKQAREYFIEAGKTWRKHNGCLGLITQSAGDLKKVQLLDVIKEICTTTILLANPNANMKFYKRAFNLNEKECEIFAGLIPKRQFLLKTPTYSVCLNVNADPVARSLYGLSATA